ncbi:MAG: Ig-like domain-containing protein [Taibaiella sp.]|nr:Ig-like domain-containing protein [Taibaiella sp.]
MTCAKKNITQIAVLLLLMFSGSAYAQISGHLVVCRGASRTILTGTPTGGTWASGDATRATVNSTTGEVTGVAAGTATISYTDPSSTVYTAVVTVNGYVMGNIGFSMGSDIRCTGGVPATCTVSPLIGNNWTSSDASIATINTGGSVVPSATNAGTVTISYRHSYGNCYVTRSMTVNPTPTVSMTNPVCAGVTQTATGTPAGGTWMSSNASVGTINTTTGVLSAFIGGGTYIRYTVGSCYSQPFLTVSAGVAAFGGSTTLCVGNTSTLTCATSGGTWSSSDPSVATIGSSTGVVTGVSLGTSTISYVVGSSCFRTAVVTVNAGPSASSGPDEVCVGQTIALTNTTGGGTWSSSSTARATVTTYGGTVTGIGAGTVNISYRVGGGCASVKTITVNAAMASIAGGPNVCEGSSVTLTHAMGAGTWTASNSHATVDLTTGVMTGVTAGSVNITYTASPGCKKGQMMIVKSSPAAITGELTVCPGTTTALSSASGGGTWSSSNTSVATVNSYGVVSGVSGGTATITYTVASWGCSATAVVTVSSTGGSISGSTSLCLGSSTTLSSSAGGGTWSSSNPSVATIGSSTGVVTSVGTGTTVISYNTGSSCNSAVVVTVSEAPSAISGATGICSGSTTTLSNSISGGAWSSGNTSVATVNSSTGVVSGVAAGTAAITYAIGSCSVTTVVSVTASPSAIAGTLSVCEGGSTTLSNTTGGGVWSSGDPSVASISASTGVATGVAAGTAAITYTVGTCSVTTVITVNAGSADISGGTTLYPSLTTVLSASVSGGAWSSSNVSIATVGSSTGIVTAVAAGSATITYSLGSCLSVTTIVTVLSTPAPIIGGLGLEVGDGDTLSNAVEGGIWSSSNTAVATIGSVSGILTAVGVGTTTISYMVGGTYLATVVVTVTSLITSSSCPGSWTALTGLLRVNHISYGGRDNIATDPCGTPYVIYSTPAHSSFVRKFDGHEFALQGGAIDSAGGDGDAVAVDSAGNIYAVYSDVHNSNKATVRKFNGSTWEVVGTAGFTTGAAVYCAIGIGAGGLPYVAYASNAGSATISVMKFNGASWELVGDPNFASGTVYKLMLDFDSTGTPYVFCPSIEAVMKYNGTEWVAIPIDVLAPALEFYDLYEFAVAPSGNIYVSFASYTVDYSAVIKYDGSSWSELSPCPIGTGNYIYDVKLTTGVDGQPYAAFFITGSGTGYRYLISRYNGTEWVPVSDTALNAYPGWGFSNYDRLKVDPLGTPYLSLHNYDYYGGTVVVRVRNGQWEYLNGGTKGIDLFGYYPGMVLDSSGTPYISYAEYGYVTVKKFNGRKWEPVGPVGDNGHMAIDSNASYTAIVMSNSGVPYIAFASSDGGIKVKKFVGGSWASVGTEYINPGGNGWYPRIALDSLDSPYVCYHSYTDGGYRIMKFNGASWVQLGSILSSFGPNTQLATSGTTPYVFSWDSDNSYYGTVKKFDGSDWVNVGAPGFAAVSLDGFGISFAEDGTPYVVYGTSSGSHPVAVQMFDGSSWVAVGGTVGTGSSASCAAITVAGGTPYVAYRDSEHGDTLSAKKFDGSSWVNVGEPGFFFGTAVPYYTGPVAIAAYGDSVYVSCQRDAEPSIAVMKFGPSTETIFEHTVCVGSTVELYSPQGGDWSSSNPAVVDVNCAGMLRGISAGTAIITFTHDSCYTTSVVTVNASPTPGAITGPSVVAVGSSVSLSVSGSGGVWSSSDNLVATVTSGASVSGVSVGLVTISYTETSGSCSGYSYHSMSVAAAKPAAVTTTSVTEQLISIVPNPTNGKFVLTSLIAGQLSVFTIDGRGLFVTETKAGANTFEMPAGTTPGIYLLRFTGDDGSTQTTRLIYQP